MNPIRDAVRLVDGFSLAALRTLVTRGPAGARKVVGETLHAARPADGVHVMDWWNLVRALAVDEPVVVHAGSWYDGCTAPLERYLIAHLLRYFKPKAVLEVGTFRGITTRLLLDNMPPGAVVHTIDLPPEVDPARLQAPSDERLIKHRRVGAEIVGHPREGSVVQILGDSFDPRTWDQVPAGVEFAFIDASHSYEAVRNDTERARAKAAGDAVFAWHDYSVEDSAERGVGRYIREQMGRDDTIFVCKDTDLAVQLPAGVLREAQARVAAFFPDGSFPERFPSGAVPWLRAGETRGAR